MRASIRELKNRLSHYLRLTKRGEIVEITDRGKPIGRIVPLGSGLEERLEAMAALGLLARGEGKLPLRTPPARAKGGKSVAEILVEERG
jgi:prevent-host-death family protein